MVDVDLRGLLRDSSVGVYCWGYLLLGILGVGSSILKIIYYAPILATECYVGDVLKKSKLNGDVNYQYY